jgi:putative addiction module component (TIGR02574 family)
MSPQLDVLEDQVLNLAFIERSHLLDRLVASIEADPENLSAWALEAERRDAEIDAGKVIAVSGKAVLSRLGAQLR